MLRSGPSQCALFFYKGIKMKFKCKEMAQDFLRMIEELEPCLEFEAEYGSEQAKADVKHLRMLQRQAYEYLDDLEKSKSSRK